MKNMYKFLLLVAMVAISGSAYAQEMYKGRITDSETGTPIGGVDIRFVGSKYETTTAQDGTFSIERTGDTYTLRFNHPDYDVATFNTRDKEQPFEIQLVSHVRYNQYGQKVGRQELSAESRDGYISFESKDKNYRLWFDNRVYLDGAQYFDNYDNNLTADENKAKGQLDIPSQMLKLRRMRFAVKAIVGDNWYAEIDFDFDGNMVDIKDAYLRRFFGEPGNPWGQVRLGQFRMPQGMQQTTTSRYLKLMERASVYKFNPNRKLGVAWSSWSKKYMFGLGLHTEEIRNEHDQIEGDPNYYKGEMQGATPMMGVSTRGAYYFFNEPGKLLSLSGGFSSRTPGLYKFPDNRIKYDPKDETTVSGMEFTVAKVNDVNLTTNMNVDFAASYKSLRMTGEYYYNTLSRENGLSTVKFSGFYVQAAYLLTGEFHPWNHREAEFTQVRANSKKGAWEVAARYSYIDLNDFAADVRGGEKGQMTFGLNYYVTGNVKFMLNYSYVNHDRYSTGAGDYADYIDQDAPVGESGFDYGFLQWRCEIDF
jgi:phosphate-selective porin OprO/OprP